MLKFMDESFSLVKTPKSLTCHCYYIYIQSFLNVVISLRETFCKMNIICADLYQLVIRNRYRLLTHHSGDLKMTTVFNVLYGTQRTHSHDSVEDSESKDL